MLCRLRALGSGLGVKISGVKASNAWVAKRLHELKSDLRSKYSMPIINGELHELWSKLLVYPLITSIVVLYIIPYINPLKEFRQ